MSTLHHLSEHNDHFPDPHQALEEPNGLLAIGGDLRPTRLLSAYQHGIFPWFSDDSPILWWSPNPRCVFFPDTVHITRSLFKSLRHRGYRVTFDQAFADVVLACAAPRSTQPETWITDEMMAAYTTLHEQKLAHSVEVWSSTGELIGGLYGVSVGQIFCGESMFFRARDASKVALVHLCRYLHQWGYQLLDCQLPNPHLLSLGATLLSRDAYLDKVTELRDKSVHIDAWNMG